MRALSLLVLMAAPSGPGGAGEERLVDLGPGSPIERRLTGAEAHQYSAHLPSGARWLVTVEQRGIDVVLAATSPDGTRVAVDAPTYRQGRESLLLPASFAGAVDLEVRAAMGAVGPGRYEIALRALADGEPRDRRRLAAEAAMTEAARLHHQGSKETREQAIAKYLEALAEWRELGDDGQEARTLFALGALYLATDRPQRAVDAYDLALPMLRARGDRDAEAIVLSDLGFAHWRLGNHDQARAWLDRALALQHSLGNRYGQAIARNTLCLRAHSLGELQEARVCYQQVLDLLREQGELRFESTLLSNLGSVLNDLGEPRAAIEHHRRALALRRSTGDRLGEARSLNSIAVAYRRIGEWQEALDRYTRALEIFRELGDRRRQAVALNNAGLAYHQLGEPVRALAHLERALALRRELADRRGEAITLNVLGHVRAGSGDDAAAADLHRRALGLQREVGDRRGQASTLNLLGKSLVASGDPGAAIPLFDQAIAISEEIGDRRETANALHARGAARLAAGEPRLALPSLRRDLDLRRALGDRHGEARALEALARAERRLGRPGEAQRRVEAALDVVESLRTRVSDPGLRATFLASQRSAYELYVDLLMERDAAEPGQGFARRALEVNERARARSLLDLLDAASAGGHPSADRSLHDRRSVLLERLNAKATRRLELLARGRDRQAGELELYAVLAELERVEAEIRASRPARAALTRPRPLDFDGIRALLDPDTLLLEYALGDERSFLWALGAESLAAFELPGRSVLEVLARETHQELATVRSGVAEDNVAASELSRRLLGPVADRLDDRRLVVVADGALHYVPFAALPLPDAAGHLIERHEVVHLPSASSLALLRRHLARRPAAPGWVAVVADPVFDGGDPRLGGGPATAPDHTDGLRFDRLPSTRREALEIARLAPADRVRLALDFDASRELVLDGDLENFRAVHFATHGVIDAVRPELSGLVLSRVGPEGAPREGFLRLRDVYDLELKADLVVLSGCKTAWGREIRGEGLVGLTQGFMAAGVSRVVASLWRVEDRVTAELMTRFYQGMWHGGLAPAAALRQAQLAVAREKRWRDPYYWGAFVFEGEWHGPRRNGSRAGENPGEIAAQLATVSR